MTTYKVNASRGYFGAVLLQVRDTRIWDRATPYDKLRPIKGSGEVHNCDHCGSPHEIHCFVRLADGGEKNIGSACLANLLPHYGQRVSTNTLRTNADHAHRQDAANSR